MGMVKRELEAVVGRIMLAAKRELSASPLIPGADLADCLEAIDDGIWNAILTVGHLKPVDQSAPTAAETLDGLLRTGSDAEGCPVVCAALDAAR